MAGTSTNATPTPQADVAVLHKTHFINNEFVEGQNHYSIVNPSTGVEIASVPRGNSHDVDKAVAAAKVAFEAGSEWRQMSARERGVILEKIAQLIYQKADYLASLESLNNGKPFEQAFGDVQGSAQTFSFYAGAADKVGGQVLPADGELLAYTRAEPVGVCGAITPWNYPILMAAVKIAPCLAMGNTLVLKPSEQTPLTALYLAELARQAGLPAGVLNIVCGFGPDAGMPIVQHQDIRKVTFTGSTKVGKLIQSEAGKQLKRVSLELGGKSPLIVFGDADLTRAAQVAHDMVMVNQGQCCIAATRTFVHESVYDEFVKMSAELARKRVVGNPLKSVQNTIGPVINKPQFDKIMDLIESGVKEGAKLEFGGKQVEATSGGLFVQPTVFSNVTDNMRIAREEIFGPVQQILKFKSVDEVIKRANDTNYGLGAGVFTRDVGLALKVAHSINSGQVYVNSYFESPVQVPFGGFKESGLGREFGLQGLEQYREIKSVIVKIDCSEKSAQQF